MTKYRDSTSGDPPTMRAAGAKPPGNSGWCAPSRFHDLPATWYTQCQTSTSWRWLLTHWIPIGKVVYGIGFTTVKQNEKSTLRASMSLIGSKLSKLITKKYSLMSRTYLLEVDHYSITQKWIAPWARPSGCLCTIGDFEPGPWAQHGRFCPCLAGVINGYSYGKATTIG